MKRIALILVFAVIAGSAVFAQVIPETLYVSAKVNEKNRGLSETDPISLLEAFIVATRSGRVKKIVIIGTLDINSSIDFMKNSSAVFPFINRVDDATRGGPLDEIVITGKPGSSRTERAVLSVRGSGKIAVIVQKCKIRFEHIEISGGEGELGFGLYIYDAQVTLGPGTVVMNNTGNGIGLGTRGTCIIDGGDVLNNNGGVLVNKSGVLTLRNGSIQDNRSSDFGGGVFIKEGGQFTMSGGTITGNRTGTSNYWVGGGVFIEEGGRFTMSGGSITNNRAQGAGGGVGVESGGRFDQNGGTVSGNFAGQGSDPNVYRE